MELGCIGDKMDNTIPPEDITNVMKARFLIKKGKWLIMGVDGDSIGWVGTITRSEIVVDW